MVVHGRSCSGLGKLFRQRQVTDRKQRGGCGQVEGKTSAAVRAHRGRLAEALAGSKSLPGLRLLFPSVLPKMSAVNISKRRKVRTIIFSVSSTLLTRLIHYSSSPT